MICYCFGRCRLISRRLCRCLLCSCGRCLLLCSYSCLFGCRCFGISRVLSFRSRRGLLLGLQCRCCLLFCRRCLLHQHHLLLPNSPHSILKEINRPILIGISWRILHILAIVTLRQLRQVYGIRIPRQKSKIVNVTILCPTSLDVSCIASRKFLQSNGFISVDIVASKLIIGVVQEGFEKGFQIGSGGDCGC